MIPVTCEPLSDEVATILAEIADLQAQLGDASPAEKQDILDQIKEREAELPGKKWALERCVKSHTLVPILGEEPKRVLDWSRDGSWRLFKYDPTAADILPGSPVRSGTWSSIHDGHVLLAMPPPALGDVVNAAAVLDWVPSTGSWRLWSYDGTKPDVLPTLLRQGQWTTIKAGHVLVPLQLPGVAGSSLLEEFALDWVPATGAWRLYLYRPSESDILPGSPVRQGIWSTVKSGHVLAPMPGGRLLDWVPANGSWRLWNLDPSAATFLTGPHRTGQWSTIKSGHVLLKMHDGKVLDWVQGDGSWRLWAYNPNAADILPGPALRKGKWSTIF